ncbi:MAG TPA: hypothetical protein DGT23_01250 [Micromonosporaceae bacterium]|nr:hypothetical protein [Micromonosporaceae bacterium]
MKLKKISIEGFRGVPRVLDLALDGKSLCLLAENGRGKSTIVDALEFWTRGKLANFEREGYRLDAAINLFASGRTAVTCARIGEDTLVRELSGSRGGPLSTVAAEGSPPRAVKGLAEIPILRHRTMADFMASSPGEKKKALLDLLGLTDLTSFRDVLVTATNNAERRLEEAQRRAEQERDMLRTECGSVSVVQLAEELRIQAGLDSSIASENDLLKISIDKLPPVQSAIARAEMVDVAIRTSTQLQRSAIDSWNSIAEDKAAATAAAIRSLIAAGKKALALWPDPSCPLCTAPADRELLHQQWEQRSQTLGDLDRKLSAARAALVKQRTYLLALADALRRLVEAPWAQDFASLAELVQAETATIADAAEIAAAMNEERKASTPTAADLTETLVALRETALAQDESAELLALVKLERVRMALGRYEKARVHSDVVRQVWAGIDALRHVAEKGIRTAVELATGELARLVGNFYGRLVLSPFYTDVTLKYSELRNGGVEFVIRYDKHEVSPPQRVVSESQLNALGLAFFLARLKHNESDNAWRTLVLDDVVNSFDADHRMGLARLLTEDFADWQVLFFTHDNMFATLSEAFFSGWRFWQIVAWSPTEGPVLSEGDPLKRLEERLIKGEAASDLGGLARFALERGLSRPLENLRLPIRFDRRALYSAAEYRDALEKGLKARGSALKDAPVLTRMRGESYLVNVGAHDRQTDPSLSTADLMQMVADLKELGDLFLCSGCSKPVWATKIGTDKFQCVCTAMSI